MSFFLLTKKEAKKILIAGGRGYYERGMELGKT